MRSATPKVLHPICGREIVGIVVDNVLQAGLGPVVVVTPPDGAGIRGALGDTVLYAEQSEPRGTGHAANQARDLLPDKETIVVIAGDIPLVGPETLRKLVEHHSVSDAVLTVLTSTLTDPAGLGRVVRSADGRITAIVEERVADPETLAVREVNSGVYCAAATWLWESLPELKASAVGEVFLTDLVALASADGLVVESIQTEDGDEGLGVNNLIELATVQGVLQKRIRERWMAEGVSMPDPGSVYIDYSATIGQDSIILPNSHVKGRTKIGRRCEIGPNTIVADSLIGSDCKIVASVLSEATLEDRVDVGPFSHLRPGAHLESEVYIGNYAEVKNSRLGRGTKSGHFSYIGDADVGRNVNIGAGTITCNFDGEKKNRTVIEDDVSIGSDTMLVAPVTVGARSFTGAGSVVNKDVPPDYGAIGVPARIFPKKDGARSSSPAE